MTRRWSTRSTRSSAMSRWGIRGSSYTASTLPSPAAPWTVLPTTHHCGSGWCRAARSASRPGAKIPVPQVRPFIAADVAADIVALLSSGAEVVEARVPRPIEPADIAVLVQRNEDGRTVRDAVAAAGVPVVLLATTSVFLSSAAAGLAHACSVPSTSRTEPGWRAAPPSPTSWDGPPNSWPLADDDTLDGLSARLRGWSEVLTGRGVAALLETVVATCGLVERVLAREGGERDLTDLRHIGQTLHEAGERGQRWSRLPRRVAASADGRGDERGGRGTQPAAGLRRQGRADPHRPPQQGSRVPRRLCAVPVRSVGEVQPRSAPVCTTTQARGCSTSEAPAARGTPHAWLPASKKIPTSRSGWHTWR